MIEEFHFGDSSCRVSFKSKFLGPPPVILPQKFLSLILVWRKQGIYILGCIHQGNHRNGQEVFTASSSRKCLLRISNILTFFHIHGIHLEVIYSTTSKFRVVVDHLSKFLIVRKLANYNPRMRVGNVFSCVCLYICLSVCPSVQAITFELLHIETSFLVCRYILTISRSSLSIKVIGQGQGNMRKMIILLISTC